MSIEVIVKRLLEPKLKMLERLQRLKARGDLVVQEEIVHMASDIAAMEEELEKKKIYLAKLTHQLGIKPKVLADGLGISERSVYVLREKSIN
jgi:DNA-binding protein H-NS